MIKECFDFSLSKKNIYTDSEIHILYKLIINITSLQQWKQNIIQHTLVWHNLNKQQNKIIKWDVYPQIFFFLSRMK